MNKELNKKTQVPNRNPQKNIHQQVHQVTYTSPLPPAEILDQYERVAPGLRDKIIQMVEKNGDHRRLVETESIEIQKTQLTGQINHQKRRDWEAKLGQIFAFIISMTALLGSIFLLYNGQNWTGLVLGIGGLAPITYHFIHGSKKENK